MAAQTKSLSSLLGRATIEDDQEILSTCNAELKKNKSNLDVQHAKVVALLKLERYDEALHFFDTAGDGLRDRAKLELAYSLYRVGRLEEATKVAGGLESREGRHVTAQALYRLEDFRRAAEIYSELEAQRNVSEEQELRMNRGAIDAQLIWQGNETLVKKKKPDRQDLETYETAFNAACASLAREELGQADVLLKRARELCRHSEYLREDEKEADLLNIQVQQLYVLARLGKVDEAKELASSISVEELADISTKHVAQNSLLSLESDHSNPFLLYKAFHSTPKTVGSDKLFNFQSDVQISNSYAVDLLANKFDGVARSTSKKIKSHSGSKTSASVISLSILNAASQARGNQGKAAIKAILPLLEQRPNDAGLVIILVQLYLSIKDVSSAIGRLETFMKRLNSSISEQDQEIRFSPGLVAILIALYKSQGRKTSITEELGKAASFWQQKAPKEALKAMLLEAGKALLKPSESAKEAEQATEIFASLKQQYPDDKQIIAGFVASHATKAPESVQSSLSSLDPVSSIISSIDVASLEESGIAQSTSSAARKASIVNGGLTTNPTSTSTNNKKRPATAAAGDDPSKDAAKKRRRLPKSRIPKDFVEGKQLDPDRWLPLRERASYRPPKKGKRRNRGDGGATQGGPVKDDVDGGGALKDGQGQQSAGVIGGGGGGGGGGKKKKGKKR